MLALEQLDPEALMLIAKLRQEAAKYRSQRNAKQRDLDLALSDLKAADARIVELETELAALLRNER